MGHIEPLSGILRVPGRYLDPYSYSCTLRYLSPISVELMAVERAPTASEWRDIMTTLAESGVETAYWYRIDGRKRTVNPQRWAKRM